jgi:hypothetical protein
MIQSNLPIAAHRTEGYGSSTHYSNSRQTSNGSNTPFKDFPEDRVSISQEGRRMLEDSAYNQNPSVLSLEEQQQVEQLKQRDQKVKAHEQAHMAAGGDLVQGGSSYTYEQGPDGKNYAVGGEVRIDTSKEDTPEVTMEKMRRVQRSALAPADPSATDRAAAAKAYQQESNARLEIEKEESGAVPSKRKVRPNRAQIPFVAEGDSLNSSSSMRSSIKVQA